MAPLVEGRWQLLKAYCCLLHSIIEDGEMHPFKLAAADTAIGISGLEDYAIRCVKQLGKEN